MIKILFQVLIVWLPWGARRRLLAVACGFEIDPTAWIGKSVILSRRLVMGPHSRIGHLNFARGLEEIRLDSHATLGRFNWITAVPLREKRYFRDFPERRPRLHLHEHAAIVNRNIIDCTDAISIGAFTTVAGSRHQLVTHGLDLRTAKQSCAPLSIGRYCMIGTGCIFLKGSALPDYSALGAGSMVHKKLAATHTLYGGNPAVPVKALAPDLAYFTRTIGKSDA